MYRALNWILVRGVKRGSSMQLLVRGLSTSPAQQVPAAAPEEDQQPQQPVKSVRKVPGPTHWPLLGCAPTFMFNQLIGKFEWKKIQNYFAELSRQHGPIVRLEIPLNGNIVMISRPEDCEILSRATMANPMRDAFTSLKKIRKEAVDNYFEGKAGILSENGEEWWRVRSRVQTPMMKARNVTPYIAPMDQVTLEFTDSMAALQKQHGEMPSNFQTELNKWALESTGLVALNRRLGCLDPNLAADSEPLRLIKITNDIFPLLNNLEFESSLWKIYPTRVYKEVKEKHNEFLKVADRIIRETEALLMAQDKTQSRELTLMETLLLTPGLSRTDVVTLILDLLFGGIETITNTMAFTLYLLAKNPEAQAKLQQEVDTVLADHQGPLTANQIAEFTYLKAVIKESMRIFPLLLGLIRILDKDLVLRGYLIPKGWMVFSFNMVMGWNESLFPRADEFVPERWLKHKPLGAIHPYACIPFGVGTRMCLGRRLAEQEMYIFLARVMQRFTVDYKYEDMEIISRLVSSPTEPLRFHLTERERR